MHQILVWQLMHQVNITFLSAVSDLGSITCCDRLTLSVSNGQKTSTLTNDLAGCQVEKLEKMLQSLVAKEQKSINFLDLMSLKVDSFDQVLVCLHGPDGFISYQIVDLIMVKGWTAQLELLHVLMEENDLEKKSRGKGCC
ncbi:hypothetical protein KBB68_02250 [Candidatus Babeliales bacterium]|nr:hypothetical protein [Candidatus Babeliales bacterium]